MPAGKLVTLPLPAPALFTVRVKFVLADGEIPNGKLLDTPPPGGPVRTDTWTVLAFAMSLAMIAAVSLPLSTNVVARFTPLHPTMDPGTKFSPITVRMNAG